MQYFLLLLLCAGLYAEECEPDLIVTDHQIELPSGPLSYTATAGTLPLTEQGESIAEIFFIAYTKEGSNRPITFIFPGGPGGSGTQEALLTFGPRRLLTVGEGRSILPPYPIVDNPETLLEFTDLVFVDPVSCGFSKAVDEDLLPQFYSVEGDIETLGGFVHSYISYFQRWNSPKYLSGGSYGTLRCCGLAQELLYKDILISGLIIHGCAIEWSTLWSERDRALPDCLLL